MPVGQELDLEERAFRQQFEDQSLLHELVRDGARRMLHSARDAEVDGFIAHHATQVDDLGRRLVVKNGDLVCIRCVSRKTPCR